MPHTLYSGFETTEDSVSIRNTVAHLVHETVNTTHGVRDTSLHEALHRGSVSKASNVDTTGEHVPLRFGFSALCLFIEEAPVKNA